MSEFTVKDGNTSIRAELGCQPSPEGAGARLLEIVGVGVDQLELKDNMSCPGPSASITCTLSGEIGKALGEATSLTAKMQDLVNKSMQAVSLTSTLPELSSGSGKALRS